MNKRSLAWLEYFVVEGERKHRLSWNRDGFRRGNVVAWGLKPVRKIISASVPWRRFESLPCTMWTRVFNTFRDAQFTVIKNLQMTFAKTPQWANCYQIVICAMHTRYDIGSSRVRDSALLATSWTWEVCIRCLELILRILTMLELVDRCNLAVGLVSTTVQNPSI